MSAFILLSISLLESLIVCLTSPSVSSRKPIVIVKHGVMCASVHYLGRVNYKVTPVPQDSIGILDKLVVTKNW